MTGTIYVKATNLERCEHTNELVNIVNFSIFYDDGQIIHTEIKIKNVGFISNNEVYESINKYFKGNLKFMSA